MKVAFVQETGGEIMKINVRLLNEERTKRGVTVRDLARNLDMDPSTYYRKIKKGGGSFTIRQVQKIADVLSLSECECNKIFFGEKLA